MTDYTSRHARGLVLEHVYHWERTQPDAPWLTQPLGGGRVATLTFRQGVGEARRMAAHLRSLELPAGSAIGLLSKSMAHWIVADLAIWMAGHVSVPMYSTSSATIVQQILAHSDAKLLFVGKLDAWAPLAGAIPPAIPVIALPLAPAELDAPRWDDVVAKTAPIADDPVRAPGELATIIYTSGTTGHPKGVMLEFGAMARAAIAVSELHPASPADRILCHLPLAHIAERQISECGSMFNGFHVFFADTLETFAADLKRAHPTLFFTVPRLWQKFYLAVSAKLPPRRLELLLRVPVLSRILKRKLLSAMGLDAVRIAAVGAAPISPEVFAWYRRLGLELLEAYGMSENCGYSHGSRIGHVRPGYCGEAQPGVEHKLGEDGEVLVKSPGMFSGYFKDPELTAAAFTPDGFLRTGDRGEIDRDGHLRITGRVKELFKTSKGKYIAPAPIENRLVNHPSIEVACVSGHGREQPFAMVLLGAGAKPADAELAAHVGRINDDLESHERLAFVVVVREAWSPDNGLLTPTMKIRRTQVEDRYKPHVDHWYSAGKTVLWHG